jgi:DNA invertase Pin-like site-specific DNA recombinase
MLIGYARVSSTEQETTLQLDALKRAGVEVVHQEKRSAGVRRPVLERMLDGLKRGDVVFVYKVDRLARSLADLLRILARIQAAGATFKSLTEAIQTDTAIGELMMHMLGAVAQFERSLIRERSMAGQDAAYLRGAKIGRPRVMTLEQEAECVLLFRSGKYSMSALARRYGCHVSSIKRVMLRIDSPQSSAVILRMPARVAGRTDKAA